MAEFQQRLLSREAIEENGIFNYEGDKRVLERDKGSNAKSAGKQGWALLQFALWYEIYIKRNPAYL